MPKLIRLLKSHCGAGLAEYVLLVSLIAVVCVISVAFLGSQILNVLFVPAGAI